MFTSDRYPNLVNKTQERGKDAATADSSSYHPYNEKNKQRVREDEARARAEEERAQQVAIDAEGAARLAALRKRAGSPGADIDPSAGLSTNEILLKHRREREREQKAERRERKARDRLDFDFPSESKSGRNRDRDRGSDRDKEIDERTFESGGHINFWADQESGKASDVQVMPRDAAQRKADQEADKLTMYLERPDRETKPWYVDKELRRYEEMDTSDVARERRERDRRRDRKAKDRNDPLAQISSRLAAKKDKERPAQRGQSERERALAMLAKRRGEDAPRSGWAEQFERQQASAGDRYTRR